MRGPLRCRAIALDERSPCRRRLAARDDSFFQGVTFRAVRSFTLGRLSARVVKYPAARSMDSILSRPTPTRSGPGAALLPLLRRCSSISLTGGHPVAMSGRHPERAVAVSRDLPSQPLDASHAVLGLDRLPKLLVDDSHLGRGRRFAVPYARGRGDRSEASRRSHGG
jgi:hypothetical protein